MSNTYFYIVILFSNFVFSLVSSGQTLAPTAIDYIEAARTPTYADPTAIDAQEVCPGYTAFDVVQTKLGFTASLVLDGCPCNAYGTDIELLNLTVEYQSADRLAIRINPTYVEDTNSSHYILPDDLIHRPTADPNAESMIQDNDLKFTWRNEPTFSFSVHRASTNDTLFSTVGTKLIYENQFIEFASTLPENYNLYGLGETIHGLRLGNDFTKTIYSADAGDPVDGNIYGSHPIYYDTRYYIVDPKSGNLAPVTTNATIAANTYVSYTHGLYNRNAHGQDILLRPTNITWRMLGGSIDLYFYAGPTLPRVASAYQESAIGLPAMQQYFTFGFHQCRWGYSNWTMLQDVVDTHASLDIPLESIWTDIDYMTHYRNFDNDADRFGYEEGTTFLSNLHAGGQHYIPIVDSAIYVPNANENGEEYAPFDNGNATNSFLKNPDGSLYVGQVWPGYTAFPDWLSHNGTQWWINETVAWHDKLDFDGIWIDMNEVSSFCVGSCGSINHLRGPSRPQFQSAQGPGVIVQNYEGFPNVVETGKGRSATSGLVAQSASDVSIQLTNTPDSNVRNVTHPPYAINNVQGDLAEHAVSPDAVHDDGRQEYDMHNLYGHQTLQATYQALLSIFPTKRPFIIGRATFAGSGVFSGHWGGDNYSQWAYMFFSIPQALSFSLFGIPMFGVDTCGFGGDSDEELCNRWMQLSAFFPFYRNHNDVSSSPQEAYVWPSVISATKTAMAIRFQLLPYMYTLFHLAHTTGSTVMRALAWEFPNDPTLVAADRQFFLGPAILITPVLTQGSIIVDGVFPGVGQGEVYYDWYTKSAITARAKENKTISAPLGHIPVYIRGRHIIATQEPALTTRDARKTPWSVIVALGMEGSASGSLYLDDGESLMPDSTLYVIFQAAERSMYATVSGNYSELKPNPLANIMILGVDHPVIRVEFNGEMVPTTGVRYNETSKVLNITGLQDMTENGAWNRDWMIEWYC